MAHALACHVASGADCGLTSWLIGLFLFPCICCCPIDTRTVGTAASSRPASAPVHVCNGRLDGRHNCHCWHKHRQCMHTTHMALVSLARLRSPWPRPSQLPRWCTLLPPWPRPPLSSTQAVPAPPTQRLLARRLHTRPRPTPWWWPRQRRRPTGSRRPRPSHVDAPTPSAQCADAKALRASAIQRRAADKAKPDAVPAASCSMSHLHGLAGSAITSFTPMRLMGRLYSSNFWSIPSSNRESTTSRNAVCFCAPPRAPTTVNFILPCAHRAPHLVRATPAVHAPALAVFLCQRHLSLWHSLSSPLSAQRRC